MSKQQQFQTTAIIEKLEIKTGHAKFEGRIQVVCHLDEPKCGSYEKCRHRLRQASGAARIKHTRAAVEPES